MLPEHISELLTAYVDGELPDSKRQAVSKLLKTSPEARKFLQKLEEDSSYLRKLPLEKMKMDLSDSVLGEVKNRGLKVSAPRTVPRPGKLIKPARRRIPAWLMVAGIITGLLLIGVASFFFFAYMATR